MRTYITLILIVLVLALTHLFVFTGSIGIKYDLARAKVEFQKLYQENRTLNCLLAKGESLFKIEQLAKSKLGMGYPENMNY
ncbi:MAG: hypothetical protein WC624_06550, partial [Candidatus Margulisiibacteriota bacterium]